MKIKRFLAVLFSAVICFSIILPLASYSSITSYAEEYDSGYDSEIYKYVIDIWNELVNGVSTPLEGTNEKLKEIDEVKETVNEVKANTNVDVKNRKAVDEITEVPSGLAKVTSWMWTAIISILGGSDTATGTFIKMNNHSYSFVGVDLTKGDYKKIIDVIKIFAYSIVLVFFSVNLIEQSLKYEIFTVKGILRLFGRLMISKVIIDLSVDICLAILAAIGKLTLQVLLQKSILSNFTPTVKLATSNVKIIGPLIDSIIALGLSIFMLLIVGTIFVMTFLVLVKLILRSFELTILTCTSPVFFACSSSDVTKEYFKKFIITFIQVAAQTLFMAIALYIGSTFIGNTYSNMTITNMKELTEWCKSTTPTATILIATCVMMLKPPKVLTNLLK